MSIKDFLGVLFLPVLIFLIVSYPSLFQKDLNTSSNTNKTIKE